MSESEPKICGGYILLSRKLIENEIMKKPPLYAKVWIWLLLQAQHKDYKDLKRGQLRASIPDVQEAMSYMAGYRTEKPTYKEIRQVFDWLRNPSEGITKGTMKGTMIGTTKGTHKMTVTIDKYCFYQDPKNYEGHSDGHHEEIAKETRRARQGHAMNKNDKNDKNDIPVPYKEIAEIYHNNCPSMPKTLMITDNRKKNMNARWSENDSLEFFKEYFARAERSDFLSGRRPNDRNWKCDFDWLINQQNMAKVLEGKYDDQQQQTAQRAKVVYR